MAKQVFIGLLAEGTTDVRFLESIVERTANQIAVGECVIDVECSVHPLTIDKTGMGFVEQVLTAARKGLADYGIYILCVHADADAATDAATQQYKIQPALQQLHVQSNELYCKLLVAIIPVYEMEAWMLADKNLLREEMGADERLSDGELGIEGHPESFTHPKEAIEQAVRKVSENRTKKRRSELRIADLYLPIGQSIGLEKLEQLQAYTRFKEELRNAFRKLGVM